MLLKLDAVPRLAVGHLGAAVSLLARAWPSAPPEPPRRPSGPDDIRREQEARRRVDAVRARFEP